MSDPCIVSPNEGMDREVHDLLTFLRDFEIVPPSAKKASLPYPPSCSTTPLRRPLGTLQSNRILEIESYSDGDESLTTAPSVAKGATVRRSWADRMSQALRDWKHKHERLAERRLADLRKQLQMEHKRDVDKVRNELHQYYQKEFCAWQDEYLSSLSSQQKPQQVEEHETPVHAQLSDTSMDPKMFAESINHDNSGGMSLRQTWKSPEGKEITRFGNGARREKNPNGSTVTRFSNGDLQTTGSSHESPTKLCYFYGSSGTLRMDQADGSVIWIYPSGQRERHLPDGTVAVLEWAS